MTTSQIEQLRQQLSDKQSLVTCYDTLRHHTPQEAMTDPNNPTFSEVGDKAQNLVRQAVADLTLNIPFAGDGQRVAALVCEHYGYLHLSEVRLCFDRGIMGLYGALYGAATSQTLLQWIQEYVHETSETRYWTQL